jgi:hypothetical protein
MPMWELPLKVFSGAAESYLESSSDEGYEEDESIMSTENEQSRAKRQEEIDQDAEDERKYGKIPDEGDFVVYGTVSAACYRLVLIARFPSSPVY